MNATHYAFGLGITVGILPVLFFLLHGALVRIRELNARLDAHPSFDVGRAIPGVIYVECSENNRLHFLITSSHLDEPVHIAMDAIVGRHFHADLTHALRHELTLEALVQNLMFLQRHPMARTSTIVH